MAMENASTRITSLLSGGSSPYEELASTSSAMSEAYLKQVAAYSPWALIAFGMLLAYGLLNIKTMPMMWTLRSLNGLSYILPSQQRRLRKDHPSPTPSSVFSNVITASSSPISEIDFYLHKSNSTYFSDVDHCRLHLATTLFAKGMDRARWSDNTELIGGGSAPLGLALGEAQCSFKKEVKVYEKYEMWTRVLCWDQKWMWLVTYFVEIRDRAKARRSGRKTKVYAVAVCKCVWKKTRVTVPPAKMLELSDLAMDADTPQRERDEIEDKLQRGHEMLNSSSLLEELFNEFDPDDENLKVLCRRDNLDYNPIFLAGRLRLFLEWFWQMTSGAFVGAKATPTAVVDGNGNGNAQRKVE
ncbi:MAG: hypothetical protein M1831_005207 [Alyxoria varia]|nr:MAG: hypothetical protein M1831_005207 [Alyxoria varia]